MVDAQLKNVAHLHGIKITIFHSPLGINLFL